MCMAACCWGPRDHCLLPCLHTQSHTLLTLCWKGESRWSEWGHVLLLLLLCTLLLLCCVVLHGCVDVDVFVVVASLAQVVPCETC